MPPSGSAISNGREHKSCLGRVFNSKLGRIATLLGKCIACMQTFLKLKTRNRVCPVTLSLSMPPPSTFYGGTKIE